MADDIVTRLRSMATDYARHRTHYEGCSEAHLECAALQSVNQIEQLRTLVGILGRLMDDYTMFWDAPSDSELMVVVEGKVVLTPEEYVLLKDFRRG